MKATTKNREIFLGTVAENGNGCGNGCEKTIDFFLVFPTKSFYLCSVKRKKRFLKSLYSFTKQRINNIKYHNQT